MAALSETNRALVFIGFMGAGKSKALVAAAERGLAVVDADELVAAELGAPIEEFFEREGEAAFRDRESAVVGELLARADGDAIALGGGSVLAESVREQLARHLVVWLDVDVETAWQRTRDSNRPLASDRERFARLHRERRPVYESLADAILPAERELVRRALPALTAMIGMPSGRMAWARSASGEYPAYVGRGLIAAGLWPLAGRRFAITDSTVGPLHGDALEPLAARIEIEPGEQAKTMGEAEGILRTLAVSGMTRSDHIAALGGGVVGDLAGFCASSYQRGVAIVHAPTTLVAQVDSAYGGKTGVDLPEAKNYVGSYHQPAGVVADPYLLETLPAAELAAGFGEVVKTALIAGGDLWERVRAIARLDAGDLDQVIFDCVRTKLEVVGADERDAGRRQTLNLGHTVGHAIETATGYARYRHGEAVGLGLLAILELSSAPGLRAEVGALLQRHGLPTTLAPEVDVGEVLAAIERDKKRTADGVDFVLLERPGEPVTGARIEADRVRAAVQDLKE